MQWADYCSYAALHRHILEGGHFNDKPLYIILSPSIRWGEQWAGAAANLHDKDGIEC